MKLVQCKSGDDCVHPDGKHLSQTVENFYANGAGYFDTRCKFCRSSLNMKARAKRRDEHNAYEREYSRKRWANDPEYRNKKKARNKASYRRHTEKRKASQKKYYYANLDRMRKEARDRLRGKKPSLASRIKVRRYAARKKNAKGDFSKKDVLILKEKQKGDCYWCGCSIANGNYEIDHIIPISKDGSNYPSNLCLACSTCNKSKSDKMPDEWMEYLIEVIIPNL